MVRTFFHPEDGISTRYSDIPLHSPSPHSSTHQNTTPNFRWHTLTVLHWQTFLYSSMSLSTVRRTRLLLNLCYTVLCTLVAGLLNAMKWNKLTLVEFCFEYYGQRKQTCISATVWLKRLFYEHRIVIFLCDVRSSNMQRSVEKSKCWGFCESLSAGSDAALSLNKKGEIKVSGGMKWACLYCTRQIVYIANDKLFIL
jgi:hypothetical protein